MKQSEAKAIFARLLMAYPTAAARMPDVDGSCAIYAQQMLDLDADITARGVEKLIGTAKWFPSIAEIRQASAEESAGGTKHAELAWGDVRKAISRFGIYQTPKFEDPLVAFAVASIGWQAICNSTNPEVLRAQFRGAYQAAQQRLIEAGSADRLLEQAEVRLRGLHDEHNGSAPTLYGAMLQLSGSEECEECGVRFCDGACGVLP